MSIAKKVFTTVVLECGAAMSQVSHNAPPPQELNDISQPDTRTTYLEEAFQFLDSICYQKLLYAPKSHELAIITYADQPRLAHDYGEVIVSYAKYLQTVKHECMMVKEQPRDPIQSISEALQKFGGKAPNSKAAFQHHVYLFTTLEGETIHDQRSAHELGRRMSTMEVRFHVVLFCPEDTPNLARSDNYLKNRELLSQILGMTHSSIWNCTYAKDIYSQLQQRVTNLVTKFTGWFEIHPEVKISVCGYTKTTSEILESLKKFSKQAHDPENLVIAAQVKTESFYMEQDDPAMTAILRENIIKGFQYGRQVVPIPNDVKNDMKHVDQRQLKLLCFTEESKLPRHYLMGGVDIIAAVPEENNVIAFNSIVDAMLDSKRVGIVRFIMRNNNPPKLAAVFGHRDEKGLRFLHLSQLPTAEDIRDYRFAKFKEANDEQRQAVEGFVEQMDIMNFRREGDTTGREILRPEQTFNPISQMIDINTVARAVHGHTEIIPPTEDMMEELQPERVTHQQTRQMADLIRTLFSFEEHEIDRPQPTARLYWNQLLREQQLLEANQQTEAMQMAAGDKKGRDDREPDHVKDISLIHPVSDFNEMRKNKKEDLVESALQKMAAVIEKFVTESLKGNLYEKAIECLSELRRGAIEEDEVDFFNAFLRKLKEKFSQGNHRSFWRTILKRGITLISQVENARSSVSEADARSFLMEDEMDMDEKPGPGQAPQDDGLGDIE